MAGPATSSRSFVLAATMVAAAVLALDMLAPSPPQAGAATQAPTHPAGSSAPHASTLPAGSSLSPGSSLVAPGGRFRLVMQAGGNLVLSWLTRPIFASNTAGHSGAHATMERDGNFVVSSGSTTLWSSHSGGHKTGSFTLSVQRNGDLSIHDARGVRIWSSHTETTAVRVLPEASPAFNGDAGDPDVMSYRGTFYAFTTGTALGNHIQVLVDTSGNPQRAWHSYDNLPYGSSALPVAPSWEQPNTQTSPSVIHYGGHWLMFYDASTAGHPGDSGHSCISVATASAISPSSPVFTDHSSRPLLCQPTYGGVLDPSVVVDVRTGKDYLIWKSNDGSSAQLSHVWSQQLDASGTGLTGPRVQLLTNDPGRFAWETTLDNPDLVAAGGRYLLVFSVGNFLGASYAQAFVTCDGPSGPCAQPARGPFLKSYKNAAGPAGGSLLTDGAGNWWIGYEAWVPGCTSYACGGKRRLYVAPFDPGGSGG